ncbi:MAG: SRPBCC family protein [Pseudomonas sp.]|uniref:SRPBCC family protein n=1 Tax=Pseudomonas sp. TaxID=306 RepID=UPI003D110A73
MSSNTIRLHRVFKAPAERVYRAFLTAEALAKWLPPHGFTCKVEHFDGRVGGTYKMSFCNFSSGEQHGFGGEYQELVANERIRYTDRFDDPNLPGEMTATITFKAVSCGTEVHILQEGLPSVIPLEGCYLGWQDSLNQLANLVEPEIPG